MLDLLLKSVLTKVFLALRLLFFMVAGRKENLQSCQGMLPFKCDNNIIILTFSNICLKPKDSLFNWPIRKDKPGTIKKYFPKVLVTPPTIKVQARRKRKTFKRNNNLNRRDTPKLLVLSNDFWSNTPDVARAKKQRIVFQCRNDACSTTFSSVSSRSSHEKLCMTDVKVINYCNTLKRIRTETLYFSCQHVFTLLLLN